MVAIPTLTAIAAATLTMHQHNLPPTTTSIPLTNIPLPTATLENILAKPTRTLPADYPSATLPNDSTAARERRNRTHLKGIPCKDQILGVKDMGERPAMTDLPHDTLVTRPTRSTNTLLTTTTPVRCPTALSDAHRSISWPPMVCKIADGWTTACPHGKACRPKRGDSGEELDTHICVPIAMPFDVAAITTTSTTDDSTTVNAATAALEVVRTQKHQE